MSEAGRVMTIERRLYERSRNRKWCETHRNVRNRCEWLAGAPPFHTHLPGTAMTISLDPVPRWPIELRNTRGLHGAITAIVNQGHGRFPNWALVPWLSGWVVYWLGDGGIQFANRSVDGVLYDRPTQFHFGPPVRFRSPSIEKRGRRRIRIDAVTPVCIQSMGRTVPCVRPSKDSIATALHGSLVERITVSRPWLEFVRESMRCEQVECNTEPCHVPLGGKYGVVPCWQGSVVVEANAVAHWLLAVAERTGLGGRTAFGFGRIRLTELP